MYLTRENLIRQRSPLVPLWYKDTNVIKNGFHLTTCRGRSIKAKQIKFFIDVFWMPKRERNHRESATKKLRYVLYVYFIVCCSNHFPLTSLSVFFFFFLSPKFHSPVFRVRRLTAPTDLVAFSQKKQLFFFYEILLYDVLYNKYSDEQNRTSAWTFNINKILSSVYVQNTKKTTYVLFCRIFWLSKEICNFVTITILANINCFR